MNLISVFYIFYQVYGFLFYFLTLLSNMDLNGNKSTDFFELSMANGVYYIIRTSLSY